MRHIPGVTFRVGQTIKKTGGSLLQQKTKLRPVSENFIPQNEYVLRCIRPTATNVLRYEFLNRTTNKTHVEEFSSVTEADNVIDRLLGI